MNKKLIIFLIFLTASVLGIVLAHSQTITNADIQLLNEDMNDKQVDINQKEQAIAGDQSDEARLQALIDKENAQVQAGQTKIDAWENAQNNSGNSQDNMDTQGTINQIGN